MLLELQISDFAIIEHLHLRLDRGLTVLTGETGAGKSIIIDALGTLRGEKVSPVVVRVGCARARVEGVFSLEDCPDLVPVVQGYGLWDEEGEQLIITRDISAESGRSVARINGRAVNIGALRDIGGRLVDIHGQHEGLSIFNTRTHLDILDRYGGLMERREQVGDGTARLRAIREELAELRRDEARRTERIEELRFLLEDVQAARVRPDEEQELIRERSVLQNASRIAELVQSAYTALRGGSESGPYAPRPVTETMAGVVSDLEDLARLDPSAGPLSEQATDLHYHLEDLGVNLRAYHDRFDFDPHRLEEIEDRLFLIRDLQRKHGGDIPSLLERAERAEAEIERLQHRNEYIAELEQREAALLTELGALAGELSRCRRATAESLSQAVEGAMGDLSMPYIKFAVHFAHEEDPQGVPVAVDVAVDADSRSAGRERPDTAGNEGARLRPPNPACRYRVTSTGMDRVEFLISPNPGEPLKPLVRIASGGESSRLLLALKSILSHVDMVPTLIFDEVDVGVGGRAGQVIGMKLWAMSEAHQVICITHLPQVAAFAETHYAISKVVEPSHRGDLQTRTRLRHLSFDERVYELAAMLDGTPEHEHSRASARTMIERAQAMKSGASYRAATNTTEYLV
ncbi:MAG: DNA repair protein RecN [Chloroflexaceae bacterium]|nr:DNA repair protein RecN [Chloroflexaceae bacterium]